MKVTITNIAQMAGVSRGTVDKVLHNRSGVSDEVRTKVQRIIEEMEYHPNQAARTLRCTRDISITLLIPPLENPYHRAVLDGAMDTQRQLRDNGLQLHVIQLAGFDPAHTVAALRQALASEAQGVILQGVENDEVRELIQKLVNKGKTVFLYDSDLKGSARTCFVGEDHILSGKIAGSLLTKCVGGHGDVAVIGGSPVSSGYILRLKGFTDALSESYPHMSVVKVVETNEDNTVAFRETLQILDEYPDLKGLFVATGCTSGVARAVIETKKVGDVKIVSNNFTNDVAAMVKLGIVDFAIDLAPRLQGGIVVDRLYWHLAEGNPVSEHIAIQSNIGIAENIDYYLSRQDVVDRPSL